MNEVGPQQRNRRLSPRRLPKGNTRIACRKGALGLGPNLAVAILDLSETGARLVLTSDLPCNQEVEVGLEGPGCGRPVKVLAGVVWSVATADGNYWVGVRFQKRLGYTDLGNLCR